VAAIILSLVSSLMWGMSDFAGGLLSKRRPAVVIVGMGACVGVALATTAVLFHDGFHGPYGWVGWGIAAGTAGSAGLVCYYLALSTGTMGVVAPVTSLGTIVPVIVGLAAGESPSAVTASGIAVAIVGIVLTSGPEFTGEVTSMRPVLIAAVGGVCFGFFFVFMDRGSNSSPLLTLWAMRATVATAFLVVAFGKRSTFGVRGIEYLWIVGIAAFDLGANLTFGIASTKGYVSITSVLASLFPVVTVLLARFVLNERLRAVQKVGVVVTMVGVALISAG
jgi:drug/metabolite transporter (DMT)-like permease